MKTAHLDIAQSLRGFKNSEAAFLSAETSQIPLWLPPGEEAPVRLLQNRWSKGRNIKCFSNHRRKLCPIPFQVYPRPSPHHIPFFMPGLCRDVVSIHTV